MVQRVRGGTEHRGLDLAREEKARIELKRRDGEEAKLDKRSGERTGSIDLLLHAD
jgi:hypothetical protein